MTLTQDLYFDCTHCRKSYPWLYQLGMRSCRQHPGELITHVRDVGAGLDPMYTCCGLRPSLFDVRGRPLKTRYLKHEDWLGCTPCDHVAPGESLDDPVYVLPHLLPGQRQHPQQLLINHEDSPHARRLQWVSYHNPDVWASLDAAQREEIQASVEAAGRIPEDLKRISSWLPRQGNLSQLLLPSAASATSDAGDEQGPVQYHTREALAAGLGTTTPTAAEQEERAERAAAMRDHGIRIPLILVPRVDPEPQAACLARIRQATEA